MKKNDSYDENLKRFNRWYAIDVVSNVIMAVCIVIRGALEILEEFTDFEVKAPFFYGRAFVWIMVAVMFPTLTLMIISMIKTRIYKNSAQSCQDYEEEE